MNRSMFSSLIPSFPSSITIGIVGTANYADLELLEKGVETLNKLGFRTVIYPSCYKRYFNFAGDEIGRVNDLHNAFLNDNIDIIMSLRGGYGASCLISKIDFNLVKRNRKPFIGFSDNTVLHIAFNKFRISPTYHGPMATSDALLSMKRETIDSLFIALFKRKGVLVDNNLSPNVDVINHGSCVGEIVGGNLSLITSTLGTFYEIESNNKIFFFEEINEPTYKIDRMFQQLEDSGKLSAAAGFILGQFTNCSKREEDDLPLMKIFEDRIFKYKKPTIINLYSGHCDPLITLPFGERLSLRITKNAKFTLEKI